LFTKKKKLVIPYNMIEWTHNAIYSEPMRVKSIGLLLRNGRHVLITRLSEECGAKGNYDIPSDYFNPDISVEEQLKDIAKKDLNLSDIKIGGFLYRFEFINQKGERCVQYNFWIYCTEFQEITLNTHDRGVWIKYRHLMHYPIFPEIRKTIISLYNGSGFSDYLEQHLVEDMHKNDIWRYKIRLIPFNTQHFLLLYRARRRVSCSLQFEFPGGEIRAHEKDTFNHAAKRYLQYQTGLQLQYLSHFLGHKDYVSQDTNECVREFFFSTPLNTLEPEVTVQEHAYHIWVPCEPSIHQKIKEPITSQTRWGLILFDQYFMTYIKPVFNVEEVITKRFVSDADELYKIVEVSIGNIKQFHTY
jgi:hypothetical protein